MTDPIDPAEDERTLVMPFVLCQSEGGPYEDDAFVAGYTCATLAAELRALAVHRSTPRPHLVRPAHLPQVDLIAMLHGYKISVGDVDGATGWNDVSFEYIGTEA